MEKNNKEKKKLLLVIAIFAVLMVLSIGGVYAYFSARATNSGSQITGRTLDIGGSTLSISAQRVTMNPTTTPVSDNLVPAVYGASPSNITTTEVNRALTKQCSLDGYTGCHVWKITASTTQTVASASILLNLNVANVTDKGEWSYVVYTGTDSSATTILYKGLINTDFGNTVNTIDIHNGAGLTANTPVIYYVMVYLNNTNSVQNDGETTNTTDETGAYNGSVVLEAMGGEVKVNFMEKAANYITNLYTNATKSTATVNNITYNLAPSVNLMNDRHASTSAGADAGDIRYYGANPNNYVWLGDSYVENVTFTGAGSITRNAGDKKLWRVIGVFDGRLKLIQNDPISTQGLLWDTSANIAGSNSGNGINQWGPSGSYEGADLMRLLNPGYENESVNNSLYWNKGTGTVYTSRSNATTSNVSFANTGLSDIEKNIIDTITWYTGAYDAFSYVDAHYNAERGSMGKICTQGTSECDDMVVRTNTWNGKVGLIYPSDYGYASDLSQCNQKLNGYSSAGCINTTWLLPNSVRDYWTLTPAAYSATGSGVYSVGNTPNSGQGCLQRGTGTGPLSVRPTVYLKPNVVINGGTGTESDPYVLSY